MLAASHTLSMCRIFAISILPHAHFRAANISLMFATIQGKLQKACLFKLVGTVSLWFHVITEWRAFLAYKRNCSMLVIYIKDSNVAGRFSFGGFLYISCWFQESRIILFLFLMSKASSLSAAINPWQSQDVTFIFQIIMLLLVFNPTWYTLQPPPLLASYYHTFLWHLLLSA